jgi:alkane 1-monooxygenase
VSDQLNLNQQYSIFEYKLDSFSKWFGFIFVWGYCCGVGGLAAHELIHKKEQIHKFAGTFTFGKFFYAHFYMAHISGHHKHVATPEDPATPKKGDGLWAFIVRSAFKGYLGAW